MHWRTCAFVAAIVCGSGLPLGGADGSKADGKKAGKKPERWAVVLHGEETLVITEERLRELEKEAKVPPPSPAKKDTGKKDTKAEPKKRLRVLRKNFTSREEAEKFRDRLLEKEKKKAEAGKGTGGQSASDKPAGEKSKKADPKAKDEKPADAEESREE